MAAGHLTHTLALAGRSIRADENRLMIHLLRGGVVLFMVIMMMFAVSEMGVRDAPGVAIFWGVVLIDSIAVIMAAIAFFPSTITEEKEARTLGLLRMADVGPMAVIAGKVLPRLGLIVVLLLIQIPIVLLAVTLGGVTWQHVFQTFLALIISSLSFCAFATLLSVYCKSTRNATSLFVSIPIVGSVSYVLGLAFIAWTFPNRVIEFLGTVTLEWLWPVIPWSHSWNGFAGSVVWTPSFLYFTTVHVVVAAIFFLLAWLAFDRAVDSAGEADVARPVGLRSLGKTRASRRAWSSAVAWKDFWFVGGGAIGFVIRMVGYPLVAAFLAWLSGPSSLVHVDAFLIGLTIGCLPIEIAVICSRLFRHDLDNHTWSSLMMLPKSLGGLIWEKAWGASIVILPSVFWLCFTAIAINDDFMDEIFRGIRRDPEIVFGYLVLVAITITAGLMIVYLSIRTRYGAIPFTIVLMGAAATLFGMLMASIGPNEPGGPLLFACFICFVISVILVEQIRNRLVFLAAVDE